MSGRTDVIWEAGVNRTTQFLGLVRCSVVHGVKTGTEEASSRVMPDHMGGHGWLGEWGSVTCIILSADRQKSKGDDDE